MYASSRGVAAPIEQVIVPLGDLPSTAGISKATRELINDAGVYTHVRTYIHTCTHICIFITYNVCVLVYSDTIYTNTIYTHTHHK